MGLDRSLRHIGEHRIGPAESNHGELGEENSDVGQDMVATKQERGQDQRSDPQRKPDTCGAQRAR